MSDLTFLERRQLENLLQMGGGYVLDFSNRTFQEFVADAVRRNIDDLKYNYASGSKANRLREFWKSEPNLVVGTLVRALVEYSATVATVDHALIPEGRKIAARLLDSAPVQELDAIQPLSDERTFEALVRSVRDSIENNEPENGLDRLHTYVVKYVRTLCHRHSIQTDRDKPLHSMFGEYIKCLDNEGRIESEMSRRILKSAISTLEAFNHVRNNQSFAHDNSILNYDESLLIFNHVCALVRFVESIESRESEKNSPAHAPAVQYDDVPF
jgi:hypothetical protein